MLELHAIITRKVKALVAGGMEESEAFGRCLYTLSEQYPKSFAAYQAWLQQESGWKKELSIYSR